MGTPISPARPAPRPGNAQRLDVLTSSPRDAGGGITRRTPTRGIRKRRSPASPRAFEHEIRSPIPGTSGSPVPRSRDDGPQGSSDAGSVQHHLEPDSQECSDRKSGQEGEIVDSGTTPRRLHDFLPGAPGPNQTKGTTPPERARAGGSHVRPRDMSGRRLSRTEAEETTARTRNVPGQGLWMRASTARGAHGWGRSTSRFLFAGPPGRRSRPAPTSRSRAKTPQARRRSSELVPVVPLHFEG